MDKEEKNSLWCYRLLDFPGFGFAALRTLVTKLRANGLDLVDLLESNSKEMLSLSDAVLSREVAEYIRFSHFKVDSVFHKLKSEGVCFASIWGSQYPNPLRQLLDYEAPPVLAMRGNLELLNSPGVGFCGSRKASKKGLEVTADIADQAVRNRFVAVSGYANGVDQAAHTAALRSGGETILVLAEGMSHFQIKKDYKAYWDWANALVISEFPLALPWRVQNAMQRNRTIIALSAAMVVIEAGPSGGTMSAGLDALRLGKSLFVPEYAAYNDETSGNRILLSKGGRRLLKNSRTGRANIAPILDELSSTLSHRKQEQSKLGF